MNDIVRTFGGAVTHLENKFETLEFPKIRNIILKYLKDNPDDDKTRIAWDAYLKGSQIDKKRRDSRNVYVWYAEDLLTGRTYKALTSRTLAERIEVTKELVNFAFSQRSLAKKRYKITRKTIPRELAPRRSPKYRWIAEDTASGEKITADTASELASKLKTTESRLVNRRSKGKLLDDRFKIAREDVKKAQ